MENIQDIDIKRLEVNKGQVEGLPKNPRFIRDERYKALVLFPMHKVISWPPRPPRLTSA